MHQMIPESFIGVTPGHKFFVQREKQAPRAKTIKLNSRNTLADFFNGIMNIVRRARANDKTEATIEND